MSRGGIDDKVKAKSVELLGYEIELDELRLMPYLQYTMMNNQRFDLRKIADYEYVIFNKWRSAGYVSMNDDKISITKKFWDIINELLFLSYVDFGGNNEVK